MTDTSQKTVYNNDAQQGDNAVTRLAGLFGDDMLAVNTIIMKEMQSDVALIPQLAGYLIASGGKRIRPLMTLASAALFGYGGIRAQRLAAIVEFIHTATLLHDDVVDNSDQRRGQESANVVFGNEASVLVGDFLFSRAFQLMVEDGDLTILKILSTASAVIAEGEVLQLQTTGNLKTNEAEYLAVIESKTAALFAAACEVGPIVARAEDATLVTAMRDYGMALGCAFQIIDDVLDYSSTQATLGKTIGDDFTEGKMTLPLLYAMEAENPVFWQRVIGDKDIQDGDFETVLSYMAQTNALDRSVQRAKEYAAQAKDSLNIIATDIKDQHALITLLSDLADYVVSREY